MYKCRYCGGSNLEIREAGKSYVTEDHARCSDCGRVMHILRGERGMVSTGGCGVSEARHWEALGRSVSYREHEKSCKVGSQCGECKRLLNAMQRPAVEADILEAAGAVGRQIGLG